jgi:hypothetical protein
MADPQSLGLGIIGVVPAILETIKAFKTIREKVKIARKCDRALDEMEKDLRIQQGRFKNECILLLQHEGKDSRSIQEMIGDPSHQSWTNIALEDRLQERLKGSYDVLQLIVEKIHDVQEQLISDLDCFGQVRSAKAKVSNTNYLCMKCDHLILHSIERVLEAGLPSAKPVHPFRIQQSRNRKENRPAEGQKSRS